jgi:hypothetical protein
VDPAAAGTAAPSAAVTASAAAAARVPGLARRILRDIRSSRSGRGEKICQPLRHNPQDSFNARGAQLPDFISRPAPLVDHRGRAAFAAEVRAALDGQD